MRLIANTIFQFKTKQKNTEIENVEKYLQIFEFIYSAMHKIFIYFVFTLY